MHIVVLLALALALLYAPNTRAAKQCFAFHYDLPVVASSGNTNMISECSQLMSTCHLQINGWLDLANATDPSTANFIVSRVLVGSAATPLDQMVPGMNAVIVAPLVFVRNSLVMTAAVVGVFQMRAEWQLRADTTPLTNIAQALVATAPHVIVSTMVVELVGYVYASEKPIPLFSDATMPCDGDAPTTTNSAATVETTGAAADIVDTSTPEVVAVVVSDPDTPLPLTTAQPTTAQPTTAQPTTAQPTTAQPTTAQPTTAQPTTAQPTTAQPTTAQLTTAQPTTAQPTTAQPTTRPTTTHPASLFSNALQNTDTDIQIQTSVTCIRQTTLPDTTYSHCVAILGYDNPSDQPIVAVAGVPNNYIVVHPPHILQGISEIVAANIAVGTRELLHYNIAPLTEFASGYHAYAFAVQWRCDSHIAPTALWVVDSIDNSAAAVATHYLGCQTGCGMSQKMYLDQCVFPADATHTFHDSSRVFSCARLVSPSAPVCTDEQLMLLSDRK